MNEQQPYEKHFSEKMRDLPVPDPNRTWKQMHAILDKEMPPGTGSGGMGGAGTRWWMIGVGAGIIFAGTWFSGSRFVQMGRQKSAVATIKPANDSATSENNSAYQKDLHEDSSTLIVTDSSTRIIKGFPSPDRDNDGGGNASPTNNEAALPGNSTGTRSLPATTSAAKDKNHNPGTYQRRVTNDGSLATERADNKDGGRTQNSFGHRAGNDHLPPAVGSGKEIVKDNTPNHPSAVANRRNTGDHNRQIEEKDSNAGIDETAEPTERDNRNKITGNTGSLPDSKPDDERAKPSTVQVSTTYTLASAAPAYDIFDEVMDNDYVLSSLPVQTERITTPSRHAKMREEDDRAFVAGLTLPIMLPIGGQHGSPYNINASRGTISDYMPMPHFQYHFNSKWYAEAELQMISPQAIPEICFDQHLAITGTSAAYVSHNAEKLYYFSLPFSIHYSPLRHLYIGTGLQYNHFISGVMGVKQSYAMLPARPVDEYKDYVKFTNLPGPPVIRPDEWRMLFDVNFYINRFTIGMRYNQSLRNYAMVHVRGTDDHTGDVNKAFQLYLRYDLLETFHNKGKAGLARSVGFR